jgi:hypothetical protein
MADNMNLRTFFDSLSSAYYDSDFDLLFPNVAMIPKISSNWNARGEWNFG